MSTEAPQTSTAGRITDDGVARLRQMLGVHLRSEGQYLQDVTIDSIRTFCNGIGELNPLFRDAEYGRAGAYGCVLAPPLIPMACAWVGRARWGLPGVHSFLGGQDWEFFRHVRPDDRITVIERVVGVEEKGSEFSGRLVIQYSQAEFSNQRDELVSRVLGWSTRHERHEARERRKYKPGEPHSYDDDELERIAAAVTGEFEAIRGSRPRYWEDVRVGEELTPVVRGPLSASDTIGFLVACGRAQSHGLMANAAMKHPGHFLSSKDSKQAEHTMNVHHRPGIAKQSGVPGAIDFGAQRLAWMSTLVTNWMGDSGILKRIRGELRLPNVIGDTTWCRGRVKDKSIRDGHPVIELELSVENQRGEVTVRNGSATVVLPSKDPASTIRRNGAALDLRGAIYRA